jgi:hypothetical protein
MPSDFFAAVAITVAEVRTLPFSFVNALASFA